MEFRKRCVCGFEEMMEKMIKGKRKKIAFVVHGGDDHVGDGSI